MAVIKKKWATFKTSLPSEHPAAAIIALLHTVSTKLSDNQYVHVFSFDFTKAFDTVRHTTDEQTTTAANHGQYL